MELRHFLPFLVTIPHPFQGSVRSPFLCSRAPLDTLKRLIGLRENAVNQASGGF